MHELEWPVGEGNGREVTWVGTETASLCERQNSIMERNEGKLGPVWAEERLHGKLGAQG